MASLAEIEGQLPKKPMTEVVTEEGIVMEKF